MNDQTLKLWRQIEGFRRFGKKRQWPTEFDRAEKQARAAA
jgi:hypothetical protein